MHHTVTLKSHRARRVSRREYLVEIPGRIKPSGVQCRRSLPVSGELDGVESLVGGRVAPRACESVHEVDGSTENTRGQCRDLK